jgi:hypothetical protein
LLWDGDRPGKTFWQVFGVLMQGKAGQVGHTPREHGVTRLLGGDSSGKVIKTIKILVVWTVSDGGYLEKK